MVVFLLLPDHGLSRLVEAYRGHGHKAARINPLQPDKPVLDSVPEIDMLKGIIQGPLNTSGGMCKTCRKQAAVPMSRVFVTSVQTLRKFKTSEKHLTHMQNKSPTLA